MSIDFMFLCKPRSSNIAMGGMARQDQGTPRNATSARSLNFPIQTQPVLFTYAKPSDWNAARKAILKRYLFVVSDYENFNHPVSSFETWK